MVEVMKMFAILNNLKVEYPEFDIAGTIERLEKLTEIINIPESEYSACHNDLLADNFILINEDAATQIRFTHVHHRLGVCRNGTQLLRYRRHVPGNPGSP